MSELPTTTRVHPRVAASRVAESPCEHCIGMVEFIETIQPSIDTLNKLVVDLGTSVYIEPPS